MSARKKAGFTLVELLVVIAIIGILVALLLPAVQAAREAARRMQCGNNLKQYGLGIHNYHDTFKMFPLSHTGAGNGVRPIAGWQLRILPYMEQGNVFDAIDFTAPDIRRRFILPPGTNPTTGPGIITWAISPPYSRCPSDSFPQFIGGAPSLTSTSTGIRAQCNYGGSYGSQAITGTVAGTCQPFTVFQQVLVGGNDPYGRADNKLRVSGMFSSGSSSILMADVTDGTSNTLLMGEVLPGCQCNYAGDAQSGTMINPWLNLISIGQGVSTIVPINEFTPCPYLGANRRISDPACADPGANTSNSIAAQYSYGFKSRHPGGVQVTLVDGSVRFVSQTIQHGTTWQYLGGRSDGNPVGEF